jgi:hypothetical protein
VTESVSNHIQAGFQLSGRIGYARTSAITKVVSVTDELVGAAVATSRT